MGISSSDYEFIKALQDTQATLKQDAQDAETLTAIYNGKSYIYNPKTGVTPATGTTGTATAGTTFGATLGKSAITPASGNSRLTLVNLHKLFGKNATATPTKRGRDISTSSLMRGINGLLFKIGEMKGKT